MGIPNAIPDLTDLITAATVTALLGEFVGLVMVVFPGVLGFVVLKKGVNWVKGMVKGA